MKRMALLLAPLVLVVATFLAVMASRPTPLFRHEFPTESLARDHCNWFCHNHTCPHPPKLPRWLTSDEQAFGATIRGLYRLGSFLSSERGTGYGLANLLVFCVAWPGVTYGLWILVISQGGTLRSLKRARENALGTAGRSET